jgi:hypothetical protein
MRVRKMGALRLALLMTACASTPRQLPAEYPPAPVTQDPLPPHPVQPGSKLTGQLWPSLLTSQNQGSLLTSQIWASKLTVQRGRTQAACFTQAMRRTLSHSLRHLAR